MKLLCVSLIFWLIAKSEGSLKDIKTESSTFNKALIEMIIKSSPNKFTNVKIFCSVSQEIGVIPDGIVSELVQSLNLNLKVSNSHHQSSNLATHQIDSLVIILIDTFDSLEKMMGKFLFRNGKLDKFYLLVLETNERVEKIMQGFWKFWIYNINVIIKKRDGTISLSTFFPYNNKSCGNDTNLQVINWFDTKDLKWKSNNFYPEKFENFYNCSINVGFLHRFEPSVILHKTTTNQIQISGFEVDIFKNLLAKLDLNCKFIKFESLGTISNDSSSQDLLQSLYDHKIEAALGALSLQLDRMQFLSETKSFLYVPVVIVIPPPAPISPFRKLILPFTVTVWILFIQIFVMGLVVLKILRSKSRPAYNFLVGLEIRAPFWNMLDSFFGGSLHRLPSRNFARFILMNFMIFCLVIRIVYQARLFIILQTDLREKKMNTIDDMVEKKMTFYAYESLGQRVKQLSFANRSAKSNFKLSILIFFLLHFICSTKSIDTSKLNFFLDKTLDSSFKGVVFNLQTQILYLNFLNHQNFTYLTADETLMTNQLVFYFQKNHFLADKLSDKIIRFQEAGLIDKILSQYVDNRLLQATSQEPQGTVITIGQLSAVFGVWISGLIASVMVCLLEKCYSFRTRLSNNWPSLVSTHDKISKH